MRLVALPVGVVGLLAAWLVASTPQAVPYGDVAVIEMMAGAATHHVLTLGPYSQFGWHHPGPLMFYLLGPFAAASGFKSIGVAVGAAVSNLLALGATGALIARHDGRTVALVIVTVLAAYLVRAGDLAASIWNAHLIVLPIVTLVAALAACSLGDGAALVVAAVCLSFVTQSSVSVVPFAGALTLAALAGYVTRRASEPVRTTQRSWTLGAGLVLVGLWLPPLIDQAASADGNLTRLVRFFLVERHGAQSWSAALLAWGDVTTAFVRPGLTLPWGGTLDHRGSWGLTSLAVVQAVLLVPVGVIAHRRGAEVVARLCAFTLAGSMVAGWSITRIAGAVGDYQVFWMSALGALNVALLATAVPGLDAQGRSSRLYLPVVLGVVATAAAGVAVVGSLLSARDYAVLQRDQQAPRREVALATAAHLDRIAARRPLFRMNETSWLHAAGIVLHASRNRRSLAVDDAWVRVFGRPFAPNGTEDVVLEIGGGCPAGRPVVAEAPGLCVFVPDHLPRAAVEPRGASAAAADARPR